MPVIRITVLTAACLAAAAGMLPYLRSEPETPEQRTARRLKERDEALAAIIDYAFPHALRRLTPMQRAQVTPAVERFMKLAAHEAYRFRVPEQLKPPANVSAALAFTGDVQRWHAAQGSLYADVTDYLTNMAIDGIEPRHQLPEVFETPGGIDVDDVVGFGANEYKRYMPLHGSWPR